VRRAAIAREGWCRSRMVGTRAPKTPAFCGAFADAPKRTRTSTRLSRTRPSSRSWACALCPFGSGASFASAGLNGVGRSGRDECCHGCCHDVWPGRRATSLRTATRPRKGSTQRPLAACPGSWRLATWQLPSRYRRPRASQLVSWHKIHISGLHPEPLSHIRARVPKARVVRGEVFAADRILDS